LVSSGCIGAIVLPAIGMATDMEATEAVMQAAINIEITFLNMV